MKYHKEKAEHMLTYLSKDEKKRYDSTLSPSLQALDSLLSDHAWVHEIHYSWLIPMIEKSSPQQRESILSVLSKEQNSGLSNQLNFSLPHKARCKVTQAFLLHCLKNELSKEVPSLLPRPLLPEDEMNTLLKLSKSQLIHLVDFLGIHDLAAELKQVVDRTLLHKIHLVLTQEQIAFLHYCSKQPMKWIPSRLNIVQLVDDKRSLNRLLHTRGLFRLAGALLDTHPSLRWYLLHKLDTGRAGLLKKFSEAKFDRNAPLYFKEQVIYLLKHYKAGMP